MSKNQKALDVLRKIVNGEAWACKRDGDNVIVSKNKSDRRRETVSKISKDLWDDIPAGKISTKEMGDILMPVVRKEKIANILDSDN